MVTKVRSLAEQARSVANYLPGGPLYGSKNSSGSNLQKLLLGLGQELLISDGYIREYEKEILPDQTVQFLEEWEKAVGIPDTCFFLEDTIAERRTNVLIKLASLGVQTVDDFLNLASLFGVTLTVEPMSVSSVFPLVFPFSLLSETEARFTILVEFTATTPNSFPMTFPISFGDPVIQTVECLFRKLKPANCDLVFREV